MTSKDIFKRCPGCFTEWSTRDAFLSDPSLELNGYKADFKNLEYGLFFITHKVDDCFSTMALEVSDFMDLYSGPIYPERRTMSEECPRYCVDEKQLKRCDALCECAFAREVMQIIIERQRAAGGGGVALEPGT